MMRKSTAILITRRAFSDVQKKTEAGIQRVEKFKRFVKTSPAPKSLSEGIGSGKDLYNPKNVTEVAALSGMPEEQARRTVVIAQRQFKTLQSGNKYNEQWQITWKTENRWTNPLMGYTSTNDPMSNVKLTFKSRDEAIAFAERNGWKFEVKAPTSKTTVPAGTYQYQDNFLDKRTVLQMEKLGGKNTIWENPGYGASHWFMPLKYHGDGVVRQHGPSKPEV